MAYITNNVKRKVASNHANQESDLESETGFGEELLEGVFSQSENDTSDEEESDIQESDKHENYDGFDEFEENNIKHENTNDQAPQAKDTTESLGKDGAREFGKDSAQFKSTLDFDDYHTNYTVVKNANGGERYIYDEIDPVFDSDDSDAPATTNTIGNIPLSFYDSYPHIGYDINGRKIMRPAKGEALDALLDSIDVPKGWTGLTDPSTGSLWY